MYLLDTHVACWAALDADRITGDTRQVIEDTIHHKTLTIADISLWEIAMLIKRKRIIVALPTQS